MDVNSRSRRRRPRLQLDLEQPRRSPYKIYARPPTPYPVPDPARRTKRARPRSSRRVGRDSRDDPRGPPRRTPKRDELDLQLHIAAENAEINAGPLNYRPSYYAREISELDRLPAVFSRLDVGPK